MVKALGRTKDGIAASSLDDFSKAGEASDGLHESKVAVERLIETLSTEGLRNLGAKLLKIADAIDQDWRPENVRSGYHWPSDAHRIERNALALAKGAKLILHFRSERSKFLPEELLGDTTWDMLLELFCQFAGGAAISVKSLSIASGASATTALRQIEKLERAGFITRRNCQSDGRVVLVELTRMGVVKVGWTLERLQ